ncbi:alpha-galactosidase, partial [bacterium]|nr:alpha-galactosidase [bacterium]
MNYSKIIKRWWEEGFPISFKYGRKNFSEFLKNCKVEKGKREGRYQTEYSIKYIHKTGLIVNLSGIEYKDFPVIEWVLYFKNNSLSNTRIIENILPVDWEIEFKKENTILHYHIGSPTSKEDYRPLMKELKENTYKVIKTSGGRPSNKHLPYFNLEFGNSGIIVSVGWPGQWKAEFRRTGKKLRIKAGQEFTHFTLYPGEEARTPLIVLLFYNGNWIEGQNIWRRWMIKHNLPKIKGNLPSPMLSGGAWFYFAPYGYSNSQTIKVFIDTYKKKKIPIDNWWLDAGWYECDYSIPETGYSNWFFTGTWKPDKKRFPGGLREISDYAHKNGFKLIVWFEPERVMPETEIYKKYPEFLLSCKNRKEKLFNFGNPEALKWILKRIDR